MLAGSVCAHYPRRLWQQPACCCRRPRRPRRMPRRRMRPRRPMPHALALLLHGARCECVSLLVPPHLPSRQLHLPRALLLALERARIRFLSRPELFLQAKSTKAVADGPGVAESRKIAGLLNMQQQQWQRRRRRAQYQQQQQRTAPTIRQRCRQRLHQPPDTHLLRLRGACQLLDEFARRRGVRECQFAPRTAADVQQHTSAVAAAAPPSRRVAAV